MNRINPYVRYAGKHEHGIQQGQMQAIDHRLFYCHKGSGSCQVFEKIYPLYPGTVLYIPAGAPYRLLFGEDMSVLLSCNFDFFQNDRHLSEPIPPVTSGVFCEEMILEKQISHGQHIFNTPICLNQAFSLEYRFFEIVEEFQHHRLYWEDYCGTLLKAILIRIVQRWQMGDIGVDNQKSKTILNYIHAHWNEPLSNQQIAAHFGYHEYYISSLVRKYTGLPLHRYVLRYKMHRAMELLQSTTLSVGEVASKVAMPDIKHFSKCFKNMMGVPPSHFRAGTNN